jgi:hypothetical protein
MANIYLGGVTEMPILSFFQFVDALSNYPEEVLKTAETRKSRSTDNTMILALLPSSEKMYIV